MVFEHPDIGGGNIDVNSLLFMENSCNKTGYRDAYYIQTFWMRLFNPDIGGENLEEVSPRLREGVF